MVQPVHSVLRLVFEGLVWVFVEGNRGDLSAVQFLQLPCAALAPIMLGSCNAGFLSSFQVERKTHMLDCLSLGAEATMVVL